MNGIYRFESFTTSNCYVVTPEENSNICYLIDLPPDVNEVLDYVNMKNLSIGAVFLTHGHYDHSLGLQTYSDGNVYMSLEDEFLARNPAEQLKSFLIQDDISLDKYEGILNNIEEFGYLIICILISFFASLNFFELNNCKITFFTS